MPILLQIVLNPQMLQLPLSIITIIQTPQLLCHVHAVMQLWLKMKTILTIKEHR